MTDSDRVDASEAGLTYDEMNDDPAVNLTPEDKERIFDLLRREDLTDWIREGLERTLEADLRTLTIDIAQLLEILEPKAAKRGRPKRSGSINRDRADAVWYERDVEKARCAQNPPQSIIGVIEALRREADTSPEEHPFRKKVEYLFPRSTQMSSLEASTSRGMAEIERMRGRFGMITWAQIMGLDAYRDRPKYLSVKAVED